MKKLALVTILLLAVLLLFACGGNTPSEGGDDTPNEPSSKKTYTVTWVDENGDTLKSLKVEENKKPSYSYNVTDTAEWDYTFEGWASTPNGSVISELPAVTSDVTYYAQVSALKQKYTVTFNSNGGSAVNSQTVEYGSKVTAPDAPTYENHRFIGWCYDTKGEKTVDFDLPITGNIEFYAIWNEVANVKGLLAALLSGYELNPFGYIPESMRYDFSQNLVDGDDIINDYLTDVSVSDIHYGHGEQWHMVLKNIMEAQNFFNVLEVIESVSTVSITAFNNYFDSNPSDTAHHEFEHGIYSVTVNFDGEILFYVLDYTAELPVFGNQTVQIAMSMNAETGEKAVRIQVGDANALSYKVLENSYEFAIKYLGVRRAMLSIEREEDGSIKGSINEFLTVSDAEIASAAEFYITEDHVSVIGNKASGMIGSTAYITELYSADTGALLGYEVQETVSSIVYDTLWFGLDSFSGINSIRYREVNGKIPAAFFVNGSSTEWKNKTVGGFGSKMFSRRFDIEFRTQYVYTYDSENEKYVEHTVKVPMLFVQEENYDTLSADVMSVNDILFSVQVDSTYLTKLLSDYDTLLPVFIQNKDEISADTIISYIGEKVHF